MAGALLGFSLTGLGSWLDRRRRRISLASALLIELRFLEHGITLRYSDENVAHSKGLLLTPVFDRFTSDLLLLPHEHLQHVLIFYGFVADVNEHLKNARERIAMQENLGHEVHDRLRKKAQFALASVAAMKKALENAGGVLAPLPPEIGTVHTALPPAPRRSFPELIPRDKTE